MPVCEFDFDQMKPLGYDAIRLNLSWSLLEPQPGKIDGTYLDRIAQIVGWAKARGIYVMSSTSPRPASPRRLARWTRRPKP